MQQVTTITAVGVASRSLPGPSRRVGLGSVRWGRHEEIGSAAYWAAQAWMLDLEEPDHYRLGATLEDEVLACLLGGHGIPAEVGLAAYDRLRAVRRSGTVDLIDAEAVESLLRAPLTVGGRSVRYRFAAQKARYVAAAMRALPGIDPELGDRDYRDALTAIPGIGLKTASWIVRNWRGSDRVSILDIHILRAGRILGIFDEKWTVERHYLRLEEAYLEFAARIGARASILDSVMWTTMRDLPPSMVKSLLGRPSRAPSIRRRIRNQLELTMA